MKLSIGIHTISGIFWGIVLGALLWLIGSGLQVIAVLPTYAAAALFFIGFAACIALGLIADYDESEE